MKILLIILIAILFVVGLKIGENHVIREQKITKTSYGYEVEFDGQIYKYGE